MKYISLFSGIEAASIAWHHLGWEPVAFCEFDPFPSAVLAHRFPNVPNLGDVTKFKEWTDERLQGPGSIDLLVGGSPCQAFSVAGLRKGLEDPRGNLMLTYLAIVDRLRPRWVVYENVPGLLSSNKGRDFGTLLGALGQLGYQYAYRVLDAQWVRTHSFPRAVPQRRRRVFVVGYLGEVNRAAEVLFKLESLRGDPPARRKTGEGFATVVAPSLTASNDPSRSPQPSEVTQQVASVLYAGQEVVGSLTARSGRNNGISNDDLDAKRVICMAHGQANADIAFDRSTTLTCLHEAPIAAIPEGTIGKEPAWIPCPEECGDFFCNLHQMHTADCECPPIDEWETDPYGLQDEGPAAVPGAAIGGNPAAMQVRRLTVGECSRLQGFPDTWMELNYGDANEAHSAQVLHHLWWSVVQEKDAERIDRISLALLTPEILLTGVFCGWISWETAERYSQHPRVQIQGPSRFTPEFLLRLREAREAGCSPYQRESYRQLARELVYPLSGMPYEEAQARAHLRCSELWPEAQRAWPLRYAFVTGKKAEKLNPDGPRYKALGNSMATNCMGWIGFRIQACEEGTL
jgi:DNA (cytosine-5)-methyltransferase 1